MTDSTTCRVKREHIAKARELVPNGDKMSTQALVDVVVTMGLEALRNPPAKMSGDGVPS